MSTFYGMNGSRGRSKTLRSIRRDKEKRAREAGIDVNDRAAFAAWDKEQLIELCKRITNKALPDQGHAK